MSTPTFIKPEDVKYVDMAIYIDTHIYTGNYDEVKVYSYIYFLAIMLASKHRYFANNPDYYDSFGLFVANIVYMRLLSPNQYIYDENGKPKSEKVKSVLNYIKDTLYFNKVKFEQSEYSQVLSKEVFEDSLPYNFNNLLSYNIQQLRYCDYGLTLHNVKDTCRAFMNTLPFKKNTVEYTNVYTSILLTFLSSITFSRKSSKRVDALTKVNHPPEKIDEVVDFCIKEAEQDKAVLFHLPESMNDYIIVLTRQLKHIIGKDLSEIYQSSISEDGYVTQLQVKDLLDYYKEEEELDGC